MLGSAGPACARAPPPSRPASERYPPPLPGETRRPVTQQQAWPNQARGPPRPRPPLPTACPMPGGQSQPGSRRRPASSLAAAALARPLESGGALSAGGGEPGPGELPGARPASQRPAGVRPGLGRAPTTAPPPCPSLLRQGWALGMGWKRGLRILSLRPGGTLELGSRKQGPSDPLSGHLGIPIPWSQGLVEPPQNRIQPSWLLKTGTEDPLEKDSSPPKSRGAPTPPQRTQAVPVLSRGCEPPTPGRCWFPRPWKQGLRVPPEGDPGASDVPKVRTEHPAPAGNCAWASNWDPRP